MVEIKLNLLVGVILHREEGTRKGLAPFSERKIVSEKGTIGILKKRNNFMLMTMNKKCWYD